MTAAQAGLWYAQRLQPANPVFNTGQIVRLKGALDVEAFQSAVDQAMEEADALHVRVFDAPEGPRQLPDAALVPRLEVVDLSGGPEPDEAARRWAQHDLGTPIDPTQGPLAIQRLFRLSADEHLWYQRIHHLAIDGYGTFLVNSRIADLYGATVTGQPTRTTPFRSLADLIEAEQRYLDSDRYGKDREYWLSQFVDRPDVVGLKTGPALTAGSYLRSVGEVAAATGARLESLAGRAGVTWPDALVALILAYLGRHLPRTELVAGITGMNRLGGAEARIPAMVMNILPIRAPGADATDKTTTYLRAVADRLKEARRRSRYRSEQLRQDLGLLGSNRRLFGPLINVIPFDETPTFPGLEVDIETLATGPVDDLTVEVRAGADGRELRVELQANPELYAQVELDTHLQRLLSWLDRATSAPKLDEVGTLTPSEHHRWVEQVNDTGHPVDDVTLAELVERNLHGMPDRTALVFGDDVLTYGELDTWSAAVATELMADGIGPGDVVAVSIPRSLELVVALVAIVRSGAAYLPVDPEAPRERTARMFATARPRLAFTGTDRPDASLPGVVCRVIGPPPPPPRDRDAPAAAPPRLGSSAMRPEDAAYVIYTSGSTGEPKGVLVEHRAIVNRLVWMREMYGIGADDRILQKTPATFDVSVWEFFLPLISGAALVIAPPGVHRDPAAIEAMIRDHGITTLHFVPSMLGVFLENAPGPMSSLKRIFCSGEALPASMRGRFHERFGAELHNLYGPTEAAVDVSYWEAGPDDRSDPVPIGRPVWNTRLYVLDEALRPLPPGVTGELYLGGVQLARGYLGRPDLTAERFLPDPFGDDGDRMYRTGDLADWRDDDVVVYRGRTDHQIKLRGFRIELGEIESVLVSAADISQAVVLLRDDLPGTERLVAYLIPRDPAGMPDADELRRRLRERLPDYMVPTDFVALDRVPLTRNGKLDRQALPDPSPTSSALANDPPMSRIEKDVARHFREVLQLENVAAADDFFLLGGHSLLAARLATRLRDDLGRDVGLGTVFSHPTVRGLARYLRSSDAARPTRGVREGLEPLLRLREGSGGPPIFCIHPAGGIAWCYRALATALPETRALYGIQARGLDLTETIPSTLDAMASDYVDLILEASPTGPHHLVGWSVGGIIAQAMAVELKQRGSEPGIVALLDAYPSDVWRDQPEPTEADALGALLQIAGHSEASNAAEPRTRAGVIATLRRLGHPLGALTDDELTGVVRVVEQNARLVRSHRHDFFDGALVHFRAAMDHRETDLSPGMWQPYARTIRTFDVQATHPQMVGGEAVRRIAEVVTAQIQEFGS